MDARELFADADFHVCTVCSEPRLTQASPGRGPMRPCTEPGCEQQGQLYGLAERAPSLPLWSQAWKENGVEYGRTSGVSDWDGNVAHGPSQGCPARTSLLCWLAGGSTPFAVPIDATPAARLLNWRGGRRWPPMVGPNGFGV